MYISNVGSDYSVAVVATTLHSTQYTFMCNFIEVQFVNDL